MANVTDFVVGLGFDSTEFDKGLDRAEKSLSGFKSNVLQLGAGVAGAFSLSQLSYGFADAIETMRQFAQFLGEDTQEYNKLTLAAKSFGVEAESVNGILQQMAQDRAAMTKGQFNYEDLAITGIDWGAIHNARTNVEAFVALAAQWQKLTLSQRINTAQYYGLTPDVVDLLSQGEKGVRKLMERYGDLRPYTDDMGESARNLNAQTFLLTATIGGLSDRISMGVVEDVSDIVKVMNDWARANKDWLNSGADVIGDHLTTIALAISAFPVAKLAMIVARLTGLAMLASKVAALAASIGTIAAGVGAIGAAFLKASFMDAVEDLNGDGVISDEERTEHHKKLLLERAGDEDEAVQLTLAAMGDKPETTTDYSTKKAVEAMTSPEIGKASLGVKTGASKNFSDTKPEAEKDRAKLAKSRTDSKSIVIQNIVDTASFQQLVVDVDTKNWEIVNQQRQSTTDR